MHHEQDLERERDLHRYQLCLLGFVLLSTALILASLATILDIGLLFRPPRGRPRLLNPWVWQGMRTVIVWTALFGAYLLWARWDERSWQRRVGLLIVMFMVDAALWTLDHAQALGLSQGEFGHVWFRHILGQAIGWAEFALLASLSSDVLMHLGVPHAGETARATRSLAATGAVVWFIHFIVHTEWRHGWPLVFRRNHSPIAALSTLGSIMIGAITVIQVTALVIAAARQCGQTVGEIQRETMESDPLLSFKADSPGFAAPDDEWASTSTGRGGPW